MIFMFLMIGALEGFCAMIGEFILFVKSNPSHGMDTARRFPPCLEMLQDSLPAGHFGRQLLAERHAQGFEFVISSEFIGEMEWKDHGPVFVDFWHRCCYTAAVAVATGNQVNKVVII
jgi:hypothetical protein